jgi:hypothetical protein
MVALSRPSKVKTIFEGEDADTTLGVRDWPQEDGSFRMLKTREPLVAKYAVPTRATAV